MVPDERTTDERSRLIKNPAMRGILWMLVAQVLFSAMSVFTRLGARGAPWQETALSRFVFGAIVAFVAALWTGSGFSITNKKLMAARSITGTISALAFFYVLASPRMPLGDAATLTSLGSIFVILLSWPLLKERVGKLVPAMMPFVIGGILLVLKPSFHVAQGLAVVAVGGSLFYALAMISLRQIGPGESPEAIVFYFSLFGAAVLLCFTIPVWETPKPLTALYLALTGLTGGLAQLAMTRAYSLDRAARISAMNYLNIIFTNLLAIPVFGSLPGAWQIVGSALVILAGVAIAFGAHREAAAAD